VCSYLTFSETTQEADNFRWIIILGSVIGGVVLIAAIVLTFQYTRYKYLVYEHSKEWNNVTFYED
jgi:hypothetical protein